MKFTKRGERGGICMGNKTYVGQGESKMRMEGVKEQDEKLSAVILHVCIREKEREIKRGC